MALLGFLNFETGDLSEAVATSGAVSISTSHPNSGVYSLQANPVTTGLASYQIGTLYGALTALGFSSSTTVYFRFYVYVATLPAAGNDEEICSFTDSSNTLLCSLRVTTTGALNIYNASGNVSGTVIAVIPAGSSYKISLTFVTGSGSAAWNCYVNGVSKMSGTANFGTTAPANVYLGKRINVNGNGYNLYFDDVAWSTSGFPADSVGTILVPIGAGTYSQWTGTYASVNAVPPSSSSTLTDSTTNDESSFVVTAPASAGIVSGSTINGVKVYASAKYTASAGEIEVGVIAGTINGVNGTLTSAFAPYGIFYATNPNTSVAWTYADLTTIQAVLINDGAGSTPVSAEALYLLVDYTAYTNPVTRPRPIVSQLADFHYLNRD